MKKLLLTQFLSVFLCAATYAQSCDISGVEKDAPKLCGRAIQGGLVWGDAADAFYNGASISLNDEMVLGLPYDAPDTIKITFGYGKDAKTFSYLIAKQKFGAQVVNGIPKDKVSPPEKVQARIKQESADIKNARIEAMRDTASFFKDVRLPDNMKEYMPTKNTYGFGRTYNGKPSGDPHKGTDFPAPSGTPVYSFSRGRVILAADHYLNGNIVMVSAGHGITLHYLHLSKIDVKVGDMVDFDTVIGAVGNTGKSSGAHLHFQINWNLTKDKSIPIDPAAVINNFAIKTK